MTALRVLALTILTTYSMNVLSMDGKVIEITLDGLKKGHIHSICTDGYKYLVVLATQPYRHILDATQQLDINGKAIRCEGRILNSWKHGKRTFSKGSRRGFFRFCADGVSWQIFSEPRHTLPFFYLQRPIDEQGKGIAC